MITGAQKLESLKSSYQIFKAGGYILINVYSGGREVDSSNKRSRNVDVVDPDSSNKISGNVDVGCAFGRPRFTRAPINLTVSVGGGESAGSWRG